MNTVLLDGKLVATHIKQTIKKQIHERLQDGNRAPCLAVILLGTDPASHIYVANKRKACEKAGIRSIAYDLSFHTSEGELLGLIDKLNKDKTVDGILVQLPLPHHIHQATILEYINPLKDVDGFHPYNFGRLAQGHPTFRPCTPYGIMQLLDYYHIPLKGVNAVVIGASNIVGRPMALELLNAQATVSICHRASKDIPAYIRHADLVVVAIGKAGVISSDWLHAGQIIIDVGINRDANGALRGDIDFETAKSKVSHITPVPGGVGPMTISALLQNTLKAAVLNT